MRKLTIALLLTFAAVPLSAGVVFQVETTVHDASPVRTFSSRVLAQGSRLSMSIAPDDSQKEGGRMHFDAEARQLTMQDDDRRVYYQMDEETLQGMLSMVSQARKMMEEAMAAVPEEQRREMERMMQQRGMPGAAPAQASQTELRKTGETDKLAGYPCVRYDVVRDGAKVRELWVTDWGNVEGGREVAGAFEQMAEFFREFVESAASAGGPLAQGMGDNAFGYMKEIDGFPVVTREFEGGSMTSESVLRSVSRESLDPAEFEPPAGYRRMSMGPPGG